jgi:hypothetical protein
LALHCEREHKGIVFACSCKYCTAQFKTSSDWGLHFIQQHGFICPQCQKDLQNITGLNKHCEMDHEGMVRIPLECYLCKKVLGNLNEWSDHYSSHWGVDRSKQKNNVIENKTELKLRIESEKNDRTYNLLNEENNQLRQIISNLCKNSVTLMQKINTIEPTIKDFSYHCNSVNIPRAPVQDLKHLSSEQEKISASLLSYEDGLSQCVICLDSKRQIACFPCGHFIYCVSCKPKDNNPQCAVCRAKITRFDSVFLV